MTLSCFLIVTVIPFKPEFIRTPERAVVDLFDEVILHCEAEGEPEPVISWFKDKIILDKEHENTLTIQEVQLNDRGNYTCAAENSEGRIESPPALVNVRGKWMDVVYAYDVHAQ